MPSQLYMNYLIFAIMYMSSIFFSYANNTESLGILSLFVVNTSFMFYMGKDMFYHMTSKGIGPSILQYVIIFGILASLLVNSSALLVKSLSLMSIRSKNMDTGEDSSQMSTKNKMLFNDFRTSQTIFFIMLSGVLGAFLYYYEYIQLHFVDIVNNGGSWMDLTSVLLVGGATFLLSLSAMTFQSAKEFSKVRLTKQS